MKKINPLEDCIFCKIARNEEKNYCIYEDDSIKAFLDINPWTIGHTIIISKTHYENIFDIPEKELEKVIVVVKRIVDIYKKILGISDVNIIQSSGKTAQQDIFHFHMHLVPRYKSDGQSINLKIKEDIKLKLPTTFEKIKSGLDKNTTSP